MLNKKLEKLTKEDIKIIKDYLLSYNIKDLNSFLHYVEDECIEEFLIIQHLWDEKLSSKIDDKSVSNKKSPVITYRIKINYIEKWLDLINNYEIIIFNTLDEYYVEFKWRDGIESLNQALYWYKIPEGKKDNLTILWDISKYNDISLQLLEKFLRWDEPKLLKWKNFLVYDIETTGNIQNLANVEYEVWYFIDNIDKKFKYVSKDRIDAFVQYLLDFPGYIVWYNNVAFDNPVVVFNSSFPNKEEILKKINKKSIDLFFIYSKIFAKRIGLNAVASWFNIQKTLSSGAEGMNLLMQYKKTQEKALLEKVKKYCRNDVLMTLIIWLYLIYMWKYMFEWKVWEVTEDFILEVRVPEIKDEKVKVFKSKKLHKEVIQESLF